MIENRYKKLLHNREERRKKSKYYEEMEHVKDKYAFMLYHMGAFGSTVAVGPSYLQFPDIQWPNGTGTQANTANTINNNSYFYIVSTATIAIPYKMSFTITRNSVVASDTNDRVWAMGGIRDSTGGSSGTSGTSVPTTIGNNASLAAQFNENTGALLNAYQFGFSSGGSTLANNAINGGIGQQTTAIYTIYESSQGVITYNVKDSINFTSNTYTTMVHSLTGTTRSVFLMIYANNVTVPMTSVNYTMTMVASVN